MRVLHVHDCWPVTGDLVNGLRAFGVEAEIFEPTIGIYQTSKLRRVALPVIRTLEAFRLRRLVQQQKYDIVHVHYARHAYMTLITGIPYFLHCHGGDLINDTRRLGFRQLTITAIRSARKVFYVTPDLYKYLVDIRGDAIFLPNPIDIDIFKPQGVETHNVLCISKLDRRKGVERFIQTIALIWNMRPQTQIAMFNFGDASDLAKLWIEEHRHDPRLILLPRIPHAEMPSLIGSFSVVLGQQSLDIGAMGMSELEAMACGKPVVCYYGYPNAYPEPPPVLVSQTPEEACMHIVRLLEDPALGQSLGRQGREWVAKYHEQKQIARRLLQYYRA